jgi:hypothetical protein
VPSVLWRVKLAAAESSTEKMARRRMVTVYSCSVVVVWEMNLRGGSLDLFVERVINEKDDEGRLRCKRAIARLFTHYTELEPSPRTHCVTYQVLCSHVSVNFVCNHVISRIIALK